MKWKCLLMDLYGVLTPSPTNGLLEIDAQFGLQPGTIIGAATITDDPRDSTWWKMQAGTITPEDGLAILVQKIEDSQGIKISSQPIFDLFYNLKIDKEVKNACQKWRTQLGARIGLVTNSFRTAKGNPALDDASSFFDFVICSADLGFQKPEPEIYEEAIRKAQAKPQEIFYIDDVKEFVDLAASLGIYSVHARGPEAVAKVLLEQLKDIAIEL
ncbi:MAG: HAD-IA family hydrolase [bacterium]